MVLVESYLGVVMKLCLYQVCQRGDSHEDAEQQWDEEEKVERYDSTPEAFDVSRGQGAKGASAVTDAVDQLLIDAENEGDSAAGYTGNNIGGSHHESAGDLGEDLGDHGR